MKPRIKGRAVYRILGSNSNTLIVNQLTAVLHVLFYKCPNILLVRICFLYPGEVKPLLSSYCTQLKKTHTDHSCHIINASAKLHYLCTIFITVCVSYRTSQPFLALRQRQADTAAITDTAFIDRKGCLRLLKRPISNSSALMKRTLDGDEASL